MKLVIRKQEKNGTRQTTDTEKLIAFGVWQGSYGLFFLLDDHFINFAIIYYISVQPPSGERIKATLCIRERG